LDYIGRLAHHIFKAGTVAGRAGKYDSIKKKHEIDRYQDFNNF
jgi:hypothetical protein